MFYPWVYCLKVYFLIKKKNIYVRDGASSGFADSGVGNQQLRAQPAYQAGGAQWAGRAVAARQCHVSDQGAGLCSAAVGSVAERLRCWCVNFSIERRAWPGVRVRVAAVNGEMLSIICFLFLTSHWSHVVDFVLSVFYRQQVTHIYFVRCFWILFLVIGSVTSLIDQISHKKQQQQQQQANMCSDSTHVLL